jgi:tRNA(Arg) A34 adenosine deaminase TadA
MAAVKAARAIVDSEERSASSANNNNNNSDATAAVMQALETVQGLEAAVNTVSTAFYIHQSPVHLPLLLQPELSAIARRI